MIAFNSGIDVGSIGFFSIIIFVVIYISLRSIPKYLSSIFGVCVANNKTSKKHKTECSIVRFGNVISSSGSVILLFQKQIKLGGPISITHKDVERYLMSILEAPAQLVTQSTNLRNGGRYLY